MTVRIGDIELVGLQDIHTDDTRSLVEQRGPGQLGGVFQDLGREPVTIVMEGYLLGEDPHAALERLRQAQQDAEPLTFAADVVAGAELTDVLILEFKVKQLAGYRDRYWFYLKVREYTEPPASQAAADAAVDDAVAADAEDWAAGSVDAGAVLQDPDALVVTVQDNPDVLAHLTDEELAGVIGQAADGMSGEDLGGVLEALGDVNPEAIGGVLERMKDAGSLGGFVEKFAGEGIDLLDRLRGIDLGKAFALVKAIAGGADFLARLQKVGSAAFALGAEFGKVDFVGPLKDLAGEIAEEARK
jgi:hypothetical protein